MITQKTLNDSVPEGMEAIGDSYTCERHGDVTNAMLRIPYAVKKPGEEKYSQYIHYYCLQCLAECFDKLIDEGKLGKLTIVRHVADHETAEKYREALKEKAEADAKAEKANTQEATDGTTATSN